jgi:hypothetical protein
VGEQQQEEGYSAVGKDLIHPENNFENLCWKCMKVSRIDLLRSSRRRRNLVPRSHSVPPSQLIEALSTPKLRFTLLLLKLLLLLHVLLCPLLLLSQLCLPHVSCGGSIVS